MKVHPHEAAVAYIESQSGKHFDPQVVAAFIRPSEDEPLVAAEAANRGHSAEA